MTDAVGWCRALILDAEDLEGLAAFWGALLGTEVVERTEGWVQLGRDGGGLYLAFLEAEGGRPDRIRARPDIEVADLDTAQARIEQLGGSLVRVVREPDAEHRVMADPEGNEFTILLPLPEDMARLIGLTS